MKTQLVKLIALRPFLHGYTVLSAGDLVITTPGHAKQLVHLGHAREEGVFARGAEVGTERLESSAVAAAANAAAGGDAAPTGEAGTQDAPSGQPVEPIGNQQMDTAGGDAPSSDGDVAAAPVGAAATEGALSAQSAELTGSQQMDLATGSASAVDGAGTTAAVKPASRGRRQAG